MPHLTFRHLLILILTALCFQIPGLAAQSDPSSCTLPPLELPLFDATPAAEIPGAQATPATTDDAARDATEEELGVFVNAIEVILICANADDQKLANAIFTERYLAAQFADPDVLYQPDFERILEENIGIDPEADTLIAEEIAQVVVREDGRLSGRVTFSSGEELWRDTLILSEVDDVWLIDEIILDSR